MPKLLVRHPQLGDVSFTLSGGRITVGRLAENTIQINHGTISAHHAELIASNGHYLLRDLDSTNHCFIDGIQVSEVELNERCKVIIGTIECEYVPDAPMAALAQPVDAESHRNTILLLRAQNEQLVTKLSDQQKQIELLGSTRLFTNTGAADLATLRGQLAAITAERDNLAKENVRLRAELVALRNEADADTPVAVPVGLREPSRDPQDIVAVEAAVRETAAGAV